MEKRIILVTGGCRSGKSGYALALANRVKGENRIFIATSLPVDSEMEERITRHRKERGSSWITVEEGEYLPQEITRNSKIADIILVDCLTLWISNLLFKNYTEGDIEDSIKKLEYSLQNSRCPVILVSNEVGCGVVPENRISRIFRDMNGLVNQSTALTAGRVIWMVSGIPVRIKPKRDNS